MSEALFQRLEAAIAAFDSEGKALVHRALEVARVAHANQTRDEGSPYIDHPVSVALILLEELKSSDPEEIAAALCHDVLEDSQIAAGELARRTTPRVGEIVCALTKDPIASGLTGDARTAAKVARDNRYYHHIAKSDLVTRRVKCSDRIDNLRSLPKSPEKGKAERYARETREHMLPIAKGTDAKLGAEIDKLTRALGANG
ncbi:MAG TPA: HD domain-containing protein [bacterium]|nr:HD domain-containing protein [bacterium]